MKKVLIGFLLILISPEIVLSATPNLINYQGRLTTPSGTAVPDSTYTVTVSLYNEPTGGTALWTETHAVATSNGLFSAQIGTVSWFPTWLFGDSLLWLGVKVGTDPEMSPRTKLTAVPFAMNSYMGGGWKDYNSRMIQVNTTDSVGIGTVAPIRPLHVVEPNGGLFVSRFESSNSGATVNEFSNTSSSSVWELSVAGSDGIPFWGVQPGDLYIYKQGTIWPNVVFTNSGNTGLGTSIPRARLEAATNDTIAGLFLSSGVSGNTRVLSAECTGTGNFDAIAVYGKSTPADFYGIGGSFEGGWFGVRAAVKQNGTQTYRGTYSEAIGTGSGTKIGVHGLADGDNGNKYGLYGQAVGFNGDKYGVFASAGSGAGTKYGVYGSAMSDADLASGTGVYGTASGPYGTGVSGVANGTNARGVRAEATGSGTSIGVYSYANGSGANYGIMSFASSGTINNAGYFSGDVDVAGTLSKSAGSFKIDHPLDPENKYLQHSFVESPDMMNVYNGNVLLDANGEATITLPNYFEALNRDFRYQLTCVGGYAQIYVASEIAGNQFSIAGGKPGLKVSWQVTGIRKDPYAEAHRIQEVVDKPSHERGKYQFPELYGKPVSAGIGYEHRREMESRTALGPNPTLMEEK